MAKRIIETKCTCNACENVWYFDKQDEQTLRLEKLEALDNQLSNASKSLLCCSGCLPAVFIPNKDKVKPIPLDVCDECGSKAVTKEKVTHYVE